MDSPNQPVPPETPVVPSSPLYHFSPDSLLRFPVLPVFSLHPRSPLRSTPATPPAPRVSPRPPPNRPPPNRPPSVCPSPHPNLLRRQGGVPGPRSSTSCPRRTLLRWSYPHSPLWTSLNDRDVDVSSGYTKTRTYYPQHSSFPTFPRPFHPGPFGLDPCQVRTYGRTRDPVLDGFRTPGPI